MKKSLGHLPKHKKEELKEITYIIRSELKKQAQMIILFGSYARGNWVEDVYTEGHITYEYKSDFDILVVVKTQTFANTQNIWTKLESLIGKSETIKTRVSLIAHDIKSVNRMVSKGQYFFTDIKREGIYLFNSGNFKLARRRKLKPVERQKTAQEDFNHWFKSASVFLETFESLLVKKELFEAAFLLHQATERFLSTILLVFTGYKPKTHDLKELLNLAINQDPTFLTVFPKSDEPSKKRFNLLRRAYIDARYNMKHFKISKEDLDWLGACVQKLRVVTKELCEKKISSMESKKRSNGLSFKC